MTEPVRLEDGKIETFILTVGEKEFSCKCGCNCFHKPDNTKLNIYECNSCKTRYKSLESKQ